MNDKKIEKKIEYIRKNTSKIIPNYYDSTSEEIEYIKESKKLVGFRLSKRQIEKLDNISKKFNLNRTNVIRKLIDEHEEEK